MKTCLLVSFLLAWFLTPAAAKSFREWRKRPVINERAFLNAIAEVESNNHAGAVGLHGERGRCQLLPEAWYPYTDATFELWAPVDCDFTRQIELAHLRYLIRQSVRYGNPSVRFIAAAWHHGCGVARHFINEDYAERVENLYVEFTRERS